MKLSVLLNIILIGVLAFGAYKFVFQGSVKVADDGRTAIFVNADERDFLLAEMRGFLEVVQGITAAVALDDMEKVAELATSVGMAEVEMIPGPLFAKLPLEFKNLGMDTHGLFDGVAKETANGGTAVLTALGNLMLNCTGCHSGYRFEIEPEG